MPPTPRPWTRAYILLGARRMVTRNARPGLSAVLPLAALFTILTACDGPVDTSSSNPSGTGGSGGQGASGGQGGQGGASTTAGSGGTGGCCSEECVPECDPDHACILGQCTDIHVLTLHAGRTTTVLLGGNPSETATISACEHLASTPPPQVIAQEGPCEVSLVTPPDLLDPQAGTVTASAPSIGVVTLEANPMFPCIRADVVPSSEFLTNEGMLFEGTGGPTIAAFTAQTGPVPALSAMPAAPLTRGEPYEITWQSDAPPLVTVFVVSGGEPAIRCTPQSGQSLTIPASLTALLPETGDLAFIALQTSTPPVEQDLPPLARLSATATRSHGQMVAYQP